MRYSILITRTVDHKILLQRTLLSYFYGLDKRIFIRLDQVLRELGKMNSYTFFIDFFDLALLAVTFTGMGTACLLCYAARSRGTQHHILRAKITNTDNESSLKDLLHFVPLLSSGAAIMPFSLVLVSTLAYLYAARHQISSYYHRMAY